MADTIITHPAPNGPTSPEKNAMMQPVHPDHFPCPGCGQRFHISEILLHVQADCPARLDPIQNTLLLSASALSAIRDGQPCPGEFDLNEVARALHILAQMSATLEV